MTKLSCPIPNVGCLRIAASCVLALAGGTLAYNFYKGRKDAAVRRRVAKAIEDRKARVRKQKEAIKEEVAAVDDNLRKRIVSLSTDELLKDIAEKRLNVLQVLKAYKAQSFKVDSSTNCITEYLEDAEELARTLDARGSKPGPLYGLPMSVKETFSIKGMDCTAGVAQLLEKSCSQDAVLVAALKQLGAVFFARTNIVQTTCSHGNSNPTYGATMNPYNTGRIPGGSTCGEAALLGGGGSIVGLGTDVVGSVRVPAAMSGHYSLKPTQKRLSGAGIKPSVDGLVGMHDCPGIMAREVQAVITVFRALVSPVMFQMDPRVIPIPFQNDLYTGRQPLKIGYYEDDGMVGPTPGCRRAVRVAKAVLEKMGHKLVPFQIPNVEKVYDICLRILTVDGGRCLEDGLALEPKVSECLNYMHRSFFQRIKEAATGKKGGRPLTTSTAPMTEISAYELWQLMAEREDYLELFIQTWKSQKLDAVLAPGTACPGMPPEYVVPTGEIWFITMMYNMLNFPAGAVPVTRETEADQAALDNYEIKGNLQLCLKKATKGATGMPLGVQFVALPWQEELVLRLMKDLDQGIKSRLVPAEPTPPIMDIVP